MFNYKKIKIKIIELNLTQNEVAEKLGISNVTLSKWINGKIGNIEKFIELCVLLDIEIEELIK